MENFIATSVGRRKTLNKDGLGVGIAQKNAKYQGLAACMEVCQEEGYQARDGCHIT